MDNLEAKLCNRNLATEAPGGIKSEYESYVPPILMKY